MSGRTPTPLDEIAVIRISLFGEGQMSIDGNLGDVRLALQMLDHARDAVQAQWKQRTSDGGLLLDSRDVETDHHPAFPVEMVGDKR